MPSDVDHVVNAAHDPVVTVSVATGVVPSEIIVRDFGPVLFFISLVVSPNPTKHAGPRFCDDEPATLTWRNRLPRGIDNGRHDSGQRFGATAGLGGNGARERGHHDAAGFGLPPGIDDRAALAADFT